jgi:hypothetical protein
MASVTLALVEAALTKTSGVSASEGIEPLLSNAHSLQLVGLGLTRAGDGPLGLCTALKELFLQDNKLEEVMLDEVFHQHLEMVSLANNRLRSVSHLSVLPKVRLGRGRVALLRGVDS